ncbi:MAG: DUF2279 domain-containing protein [Bacteroidetes bacterium]|nr:DUF2279 domain-containing protein [Bacteroidota bacterium]
MSSGFPEVSSGAPEAIAPIPDADSTASDHIEAASSVSSSGGGIRMKASEYSLNIIRSENVYKTDSPADDSLRAWRRGGFLGPPYPFEVYNPEDSQWKWGRVGIISGVLGATVTGVHIYQRNAWWSDRRTSFHFQHDSEYALNVDKLGHFYGGALGAFIGRKSLEWSGASRTTALWGGTAMGALFQLYVEIEDGFAPDWGFSPGDAYANVLGAAWPIAQHYVPGLEHMHPKFSYWPSKAVREGTHTGNMIDDYEGQTMWMGIHLHGLLPQSLKPYWPEWLGIAVGVAVRNMPIRVDGQYVQHNPLERSIILALDYDMTKIIPGEGWFITALKEGLNFIHFPSPAIRISPDFISYGLYF